MSRVNRYGPVKSEYGLAGIRPEISYANPINHRLYDQEEFKEYRQPLNQRSSSHAAPRQPTQLS